MENIAIDVTHLTKGYGKNVAVDDVCLAVRHGEILGVLGPNGAGKTTLLETIVGMRTPSGGHVAVFGLDPAEQRAALNRRISIQPQRAGLFEYLTVQETVELFASFHTAPLPVEELIQGLGLEEKRNAAVRSLSGGQRQRLLVAAALVGNTDLLFLDEPTGSLDPQARRQIWDIVTARKEAGRTVVLTTHSMEEAKALCDRVAIMARGKILDIGTPQQLVDKYLPEQMIVFEADNKPDMAVLKSLPGVQGVLVDSAGGRVVVRLRSTGSEETLRAVLQHGFGVRSLRTEQGTLEDVFLLLVGNTQGGKAR